MISRSLIGTALMSAALGAVLLLQPSLADAQATQSNPQPPVRAPVAAPPAGQPPRLPFPVVATPQIADLGYIKPRAVVKAEFVLTNTLPSPVKVIKAEPSCTCTTLDLVGKVIPAKGSITVPVEMKTSAATGMKSAQVGIVFEGLNGAVVIAMKGEVTSPIRGTSVDAAGATVPYIDADTDPTRTKGTVTVKSIDSQPFTLQAVQGSAPQFIGFDPSKDAPRSIYEVGYDISAFACDKMPPYLIMQTDRPDSRLIDMRVRHQCTKFAKKLHFGEYRANAGVVSPGGSSHCDVLLKNLNGAKVVSIRSLDPRVTATLLGQKSDRDGALVDFQLALAPDAKGLVFFSIELTARLGTQEISDTYLVYLLAE